MVYEWATDPVNRDVVALVRAGLSYTEALRLDNIERLAFLLEYSRQERRDFERSKGSA